LQDDAEDLTWGIEVMDRIYEQAHLTIVAACGADANVGFPGLRFGTRNGESQLIEVKPGVYMGVYFELNGLLEDSVDFDVRGRKSLPHRVELYKITAISYSQGKDRVSANILKATKTPALSTSSVLTIQSLSAAHSQSIAKPALTAGVLADERTLTFTTVWSVSNSMGRVGSLAN
jgi:hypothetical protein